MQRIVKRRAIRACLVSGLAALTLSAVIGMWAVTGETRRDRVPDPIPMDERDGDPPLPPVEFEIAPVERELGVMLTR